MARCSGRASRAGSKVWERLQGGFVTGLVLCEPFLGLDLGCWGFLKLVRKAFEMGLGKGLLRMRLGVVIRSCNDFAIIRPSLAVL